MRLLKVVLTALFAVVAVFAGLFAAAIVALTGAAVLLVRRLLRGGSAMRPAPQIRPRARRHDGGDAIEVTATEVHVEPPARLQ